MGKRQAHSRPMKMGIPYSKYWIRFFSHFRFPRYFFLSQVSGYLENTKIENIYQTLTKHGVCISALFWTRLSLNQALSGTTINLTHRCPRQRSARLCAVPEGAHVDLPPSWTALCQTQRFARNVQLLMAHFVKSQLMKLVSLMTSLFRKKVSILYLLYLVSWWLTPSWP